MPSFQARASLDGAPPHGRSLSLIGSLALSLTALGCAHTSRPSALSGGARLVQSADAASLSPPPLPGLGLPSLGMSNANADMLDGSSAGPQRARIAHEAEAATAALMGDYSATPAPAPSPAAPPPDVAPPLASVQAAAQTASDAVQSGPLLVYSASFLLSVYEVDKTQASLQQTIKALGGFVSSQTDTHLTLRVPSPKFEAALRAVETAGKVRARNLEALDVGDQYRDVELRLHTAELLRQRLEVMLAQADKVPDALKVQAELERIVREIEQLKGQLRMLNDRIAYSTLVIEFRPEARPDLDDSDVFKLPFPWLEELGLHHLLELTP
jgi:hypothetical protein